MQALDFISNRKRSCCLQRTPILNANCFQVHEFPQTIYTKLAPVAGTLYTSEGKSCVRSDQSIHDHGASLDLANKAGALSKRRRAKDAERFSREPQLFFR